VGLWADTFSGTTIDSCICGLSSLDPVVPLNGTGAAGVSSVVGVGEVRESTPRRTSLVVMGSLVGSMVPLAAMGPVALGDSTPRATSFAVSGAVVSRVGPLAGTCSATGVGSDVTEGDVTEGDVPDSAPCLPSLAALTSVAGKGERRPLNPIFFPVLLMRLKTFLTKERFACCGLDIGYSPRDARFQERRAYERVPLYIKTLK